MRVALLTLLYAVTISAQGPRRLMNGNAACPCVDPYPLAGGSANNDECTGVMRGGVCYPREYGSRGCRNYDSIYTPECQVARPPAWCSSLFCWVAPWNCNRPHTRSSFFDGTLMANATLLAEAGPEYSSGDSSCDTSTGGATPWNHLSYSYETCGNLDLYHSNVSRMGLATSRIRERGPLRLSIPGDEMPYITTAGPDETFVNGTSRRDGSIVRFAVGLLANLSIPWVEVPISPESRDYSPLSSFTACTHDIALDNTDLCVGSFWPFPYRRELSDFTAQIEMAEFHVVAPRQSISSSSISLDVLLFRPFLPFTGRMWVALICTLLYAGYALYTLNANGYVDAEVDDPDLYAEGDNGPQTLTGLTAEAKSQLKWARNPMHMICPTGEDEAKDAMLSAIQAVHAFLSGGDFRQEPKSVQAWVVFIGLSFRTPSQGFRTLDVLCVLT